MLQGRQSEPEEQDDDQYHRKHFIPSRGYIEVNQCGQEQVQCENEKDRRKEFLSDLRRSTDPDAMRFVSNDPDHPSEFEGEKHGHDDQCSHRQSSAWGLYGVVVLAKTLMLGCLPSA